MSPKVSCPLCGGALQEVRYPEDSMLNYDQFMSVRAGDYFCKACKGNEARTGFKYFWESELSVPPKVDPIQRRINLAIAAEREACAATIVELAHTCKNDNDTALLIHGAAAIRRRGV